MEKRIQIDTWQKVSRGDFNNFGLFPQIALDTIVENALIPDKAFDGFSVVQSAAAEVTVGNGHLWSAGKVYFNNTDGGQVVSMLTRLPSATKRIVAITVWGQEIDSALIPRTFLTDADTRTTIAREASTEKWRWANISPVSGIEGPDPQAPAVADNVLVVAWVTLTTTGVESITPAYENQIPTLRDADNRLNAFDIWKLAIGTRIDTLSSDLLALASRIFGLAQFNLVRQIARDIAMVKDLSRLPDAYTSYGFDHFLSEDESDPDHVDWLAKIEEGCRFPPAAGLDAQLGLLNPLDEGVINSNNVLLPAWDHAVWQTNLGAHSELSISQYAYQTMDMVQKMMSRQVTRFGTPFTLCTNNAYWDIGGGKYYVDSHGITGVLDYVFNTFRRSDGEVFELINAWTPPGGDHPFTLRLQKIWVDTIQEPYWERVVTNYSVSGAVLGETFVVSQDGWLSKMEIFFSKVAASGNVDMLIMEVTNGQPDPRAVIARSTVLAADLKVATAAAATQGTMGTNFLFQPTFLRKGRYAFVLVTPGNHYVWILNNTNYVSGTLFYSTDGHWFQGDLTKDIAFRTYFCRFRANTSRIQLLPLQLQDGIAAIDINADTIIPDGCKMFYEVQKAGIWYSLTNSDGGPDDVLGGLPPLLPFRVVFVGTDSQQPALGVASNSRVTTWRPRADFRHISDVIELSAATTNIEVDVRLEAWRGAPYHSFTPKLLTGATHATVTAPTTSTTVPAPDDPDNAIIYHLTWTGVTSFSNFRLRLEGTTDNVLTTFHIAERFHVDPTP